MEDLLITTLSVFGYPVFRQGSLAKDAKYPDHFFTFWNNASDSDGFFDNSGSRTVWDFDCNFYSIDPEKTYSCLSEAVSRLKDEGFIISGKGYDIASDEPTHTGRGVNALYIQNND